MVLLTLIVSCLVLSFYLGYRTAGSVLTGRYLRQVRTLQYALDLEVERQKMEKDTKVNRFMGRH